MRFLSEIEINSLLENDYVILEHWLDLEKLQQAHKDFETILQSGQFKKANIVHGNKPDLIRGDWTCWLDENAPGSLQEILQSLASWVPKLNEVFYSGIKRLESHLAFYPPGLGYEKHLDQPQGKKARVFTYALYLNLQWPPENGGELCLYSTGNAYQIIEKISPIGGRLVLFSSDKIPHEVCPGKDLRRSLTGWFRSDAL